LLAISMSDTGINTSAPDDGVYPDGTFSGDERG
jgi:hypothetical protein